MKMASRRIGNFGEDGVRVTGNSFSFGRTKKEMAGFGQGARIGNFGEDGVRATGNNFSFGKPKNGRFWAARPDWELW